MIRYNFLFSLCLSSLLLQAPGGIAFHMRTPNSAPAEAASAPTTTTTTSSSRRSFFETATAWTVGTTLATVTTAVITPPPTSCWASGGATAGGAYLLSAKQRYNERVKAGIRQLLVVATALESGSSKEAKAYFNTDNIDTGSWKDLSAAGYLLSNAFRINSTASPDKIPAVKKFKAFAAEVDGLTKTLKKKGAAAASEQFASVEAALEVWLGEIELPPAREL